MADLPGALLLRAGVLRAADLATVIALRDRDGGSFGECLVRLGLIDEDTLADFYQKRLMIMRVPDHQLVTVPPAVLATVPSDMAAEFRVLPLDLDLEGGLTLAMADPTDNHAVDEVAFFADRFVVRVVATESAVRNAIERHYGLHFATPRAADRVRRATSAERQRATPTAPPTAPRTETPPRPRTEAPPGPRTEAPPDRPPNPSPPPPTSRFAAAAAPRDRKPSHDDLDEKVVLLTNVKYSDSTPLPIPVPPPDDYQPIQFPEKDEPVLLTRPKSFGRERPRRETLPGFGKITVPDPPLAALRACSQRDQIAEAVLGYVGLLFRRAAFFVIKKSILVGHDARGGDLDRASIRRLIINVDAPSLFRDVIVSRLPYRGPLPETPANRAFAQELGGVDSDVLLMPVAVRDRVIAVIYADGAAQPLPDAALHATMREAGLAYERLILESKARES